MGEFLDGILMPFRLLWALVRGVGWGIATAYRTYMSFVNTLGKPWPGMIHSTVFVSIGQGIVWLLLLL